jgi:hypothetical protein
MEENTLQFPPISDSNTRSKSDRKHKSTYSSTKVRISEDP